MPILPTATPASTVITAIADVDTQMLLVAAAAIAIGVITLVVTRGFGLVKRLSR